MKSYIVSHDIGTSSDKAVLVDFDGNVIAEEIEEYPTYYPRPSWVEQNPEDYWQAVVKTTKNLIENNKIDKKDVKGLIFSTQAMGLIPVNNSGKPLYNNITWVDGRAQKQAQSLMRRVGGKKIFKLFAGTEIMGKDVVAKIRWLKEERPDIYNHTKYFLDVNGYLKMRATGKMVAELSGASSYGLDLKKKTWLSAMSLLGIDMKKLPPLVKSTDVVGTLLEDAANSMGLFIETPVFGGCDDVQAAAVGSGMTKDGDIHIYLGTSAWVCASSKDHTAFKNGAAAIQSADPNMNIIAGITESAGSNIQWIMKQFFRHEREKYQDGVYAYMGEKIKKIPPGSDHLICTPWMQGERCPVSTTATRATIFNVNPEHTREHLMRSVYEGIGYNLRWILENFKKDYHFKCSGFRIIGGGALDDAWMQIIADITGQEFCVIKNPRSAGAIGATIIALVGLGHLKDFSQANDILTIEKTFTPQEHNIDIYNRLFATYKKIYYSLRRTYNQANSARFKGEYTQDAD